MTDTPFKAVHFIGFTDSRQYWSARQVFGDPDFIHVRWDTRVVTGGEFDPDNDTLVFARGTDQDTPSQWAWNDSERF
jgi:hypothetical protein